MTFRAKRPRKAIDSVSQWLSAWNNYEFLVMSTVSSRYADMSRYRDFIQKCARKFIWYAIHAYDCRFRAQVASGANKMSLADTDSDLYTSVFDITTIRRDIRTCHRCKSRDHLVNDCPFPAAEQTEAAPKGYTKPPRFKLRETCINFNSGRCRFPSCRRTHVCNTCGGPEPAYRCPCNNTSTGPS